jgi:tRNA A64-2'-O-ribosylphosphate transferase
MGLCASQVPIYLHYQRPPSCPPSAGSDPSHQPHRVTYDYVPGAGDDEESWAHGLTPQIMWAHRAELLGAGMGGIQAEVHRLLRQQRRSQQDRRAAGSGTGTAGTAGTAWSGGEAGLGSKEGGGQGLCAIGDTGLLVGSLHALHAVGALSAASELEGTAGMPAVLNVGSSACAGWGGGRGVSEASSHSTGDEGVQGGGSLWLPIAPGKQDRHALLAALPAALRFVQGQLQVCHMVAVVCDDGCSTSVAVALASLLALFALEEGEGGACTTFRQAQALVWDASTHTPVPVVGAGQFTRTTVRQYLAALSQDVPRARLSKVLLKQVYNCFLPDRMTPRTGVEDWGGHSLAN